MREGLNYAQGMNMAVHVQKSNTEWSPKCW